MEKSYMVAEATNLPQLCEYVSRMMHQGWLPHGNLVVITDIHSGDVPFKIYYQPMMKMYEVLKAKP